MKPRFSPSLALGCIFLALTAPAHSRADDNKFMQVKPVVNEQSGFLLRIDVNHKDRIYREGDKLVVSVLAEKDCYIYLLYYDAAGEITCLFPNQYHKDNFIKAKTEVQVPAAAHPEFEIETSAPFGDEVLQVVATLQPIDLFDGKIAKSVSTRRPTASLSVEDVRQALGKLMPLKGQRVIPVTQTSAGGSSPSQDREPAPAPSQDQGSRQDARLWAERKIEIKTIGQKQRVASKAKRLGVCIGISSYQDKRIRQLSVSHLDAQHMAKALQETCGVDKVVALINEQATLEAIRSAILGFLAKESKPGDTVFIYFSGHGGRCADTDGDEEDGYDEYLVPYDGVYGKPETMLIDDMFARWMAELDGRQVCIVLDNCYSGGASKGGVKGIMGPASLGQSRALAFDFFDGELRRAKDLGQKETAVIAASQANQIAWEKPSGEGSVLTYFLLNELADPKADTNGDGHLSVTELYRAVSDQVEKYVEKEFQAEQKPLLIDNAEDRIIFRP